LFGVLFGPRYNIFSQRAKSAFLFSGERNEREDEFGDTENDYTAHQKCLLRIKSGDKEAFECLVKKYLDFANCAALAVILDRQIAQETVNEAFVRLLGTDARSPNILW
jgi:hypothetical protein